MIPKTLTAISEIPLTGNDKVDESRLPVPNVHKINLLHHVIISNEK